MRTDFVVLFERAGRQFCDLVAQVGDGQWSARTPCSEWDVRALVDHVVRGNVAVVPVLWCTAGIWPRRSASRTPSTR
ncbi:maleylpyruvate isomerase N-terminal domain-containing protein [Micromonospora sp. LOL_023]|uniref:maleylpyruvate isomerase N-terminal domain-containing protein n=1 Tax=Micromonospora sp. LOL_023 TaxID=3345418 RepID=UPI003A86B5FC